MLALIQSSLWPRMEARTLSGLYCVYYIVIIVEFTLAWIFSLMSCLHYFKRAQLLLQSSRHSKESFKSLWNELKNLFILNWSRNHCFTILYLRSAAVAVIHVVIAGMWLTADQKSAFTWDKLGGNACLKPWLAKKIWSGDNRPARGFTHFSIAFLGA